MICLEKADSFTRELARLMEKHGLTIVADDSYSTLCLNEASPDMIDHYIEELLDNTPRK